MHEILVLRLSQLYSPPTSNISI